MTSEEKQLNRKTAAVRTFLIIGFVVLWEVSARLKWYDTFFTSYPTEILMDLVDFIRSGDLVYHTVIPLEKRFWDYFLVQ